MVSSVIHEKVLICPIVLNGKKRGDRSVFSVGGLMKMSKITWDFIVKHEPMMAVMLKRAQAIKDDKSKPSFCAHEHWYGWGKKPRGGLKHDVIYLVGWHARSPELRSMEAYDVGYMKVYNALPDCRNCGCL